MRVDGPGGEGHAFFGPGPVVGLLVDDFEETRARKLAAGIEFVGPPRREGAAVWNYFGGRTATSARS